MTDFSGKLCSLQAQYSYIFFGAMWLNVRGNLCFISSSPLVEPHSMMPVIPFLSPL